MSSVDDPSLNSSSLLTKANKKITDLRDDIGRLSAELRDKESLLTRFMVLAADQAQRIASLSTATQDTAVWDPSTCPRPSSCSTPNRLSSWSEVVVRGHKRDSGPDGAVPLPRLSLSNQYAALSADTPAPPADDHAVPARPDPDPPRTAPADAAPADAAILPSVVANSGGRTHRLTEGQAWCSTARSATSVSRRRTLKEAVLRRSGGFPRPEPDVEANTVRLKEHHQDVLVLEKSLSRGPQQGATTTSSSHHKYTVISGTPEKILEHLLEMTRLDAHFTESDPALDDFVLMHCVFIPNAKLCPVLMAHYQAEASQGSEQEQLDYALSTKRRVVRLVLRWAAVHGHHLQEEPASLAFLQEFLTSVTADAKVLPLKDQLPELQKIVNTITEDARSSQRKHKVLLRQFSMGHEKLQKRQPIRSTDEILFKVYCCDHTYTTIRVAVAASVREVLNAVADKLGSAQVLLLVSLSSAGDKVVQSPQDISVFSTLTVNGRLFACTRDQLDSLVPLPEQEGPSGGSLATFELMSSKDVAYHLTLYDWELFHCMHEHELVYHTMGRHCFQRTTANLDLFLRRFNELQLWVVTEVCLCSQLNKRVQLFKKFIKIAAHCKEYKNLNSFFAIVMGMSNPAVSRLTQTWEKLPSKFKKFYGEFESLMDPSRNHRAYRLTAGKLQPPVIPFMPLLIKDMTFTHEGNKTFIDNLVNFEKMRMIANTLKTVRYCRSQAFSADSSQSNKSHPEVRSYVRQLSVIDNQRTLTQLSLGLEPRRT